MLLPLLLVIIIFSTIVSPDDDMSEAVRSCYSLVYCDGPLLHLIQTSGIFNDSKTFVDMSMVNSPNATLANFQILMSANNNEPTVMSIHRFIFQNFQFIGELDDYFPDDFKTEPRLVKEIMDPSVRSFTKSLIGIWPTLARLVSSEVHHNPERFSLIPVSNGFIVPGGRFKELYYWDSYWIVKGLLLSDMIKTSRGMILNLMSMVERFGFVPNGGRVYYLSRSQPPVLTLMVADYVKITKDFVFLRENVGTLQKELNFWLTHRLVSIERHGKTYRLAHFDSASNTPRPESYIEDIETCIVFEQPEDQRDCYRELKSGAESGWDFTSRWIFDANGENSNNLSLIQTRRNIPVDLNAFLFKAFHEMYHFCLILRETTDAEFWQDLADEWRDSIKEILYDEEDGVWYDYDIKLNRLRKNFYPTNLMPMWAGVDTDEAVKNKQGQLAVAYLKKNNIRSYLGGIPSSLLTTGQQWDFPNAWSPLQGIVIFGLELSGDTEAKEWAKHFAKTWVRSNIRAYWENKAMFEKYNVQSVGQFGGGGEYHIQAGFGWSNGLVLELINYYYRTKTRRYYKDFL